jgi:hypothetical protein
VTVTNDLAYCAAKKCFIRLVPDHRTCTPTAATLSPEIVFDEHQEVPEVRENSSYKLLSAINHF